MKKFIIGLGIAAMVMGMASMASASFDSAWVINLKASQNADGSAAKTSAFGVKTGYSDGFGAEDLALAPGPVGAYAYTSLDGKTDQYVTDMHSAFTGATQIWNITLGGGSTFTAGSPITIWAWNPKNTTIPVNNPNNDFTSGGETISLYEVAGGKRTLLWTVNDAVNGTGAVGNVDTFTKTFASGVGTTLQLEVASVPEPGSMVAMLSGLAGLVGFGIRRRK